MTIGLTAIGELAIGELPAGYDLSVPSPLPALLNDPEAELLFLLEAWPLNLTPDEAGGPPYALGEVAIGEVAAADIDEGITVRLASRTFRTSPSCDPANASYPPRLLAPYNFETVIPEPASGESLGRSAFGAVRIANYERELDYLLNASWEGRPVDLLIGGTFDAGLVTEQTLAIDEFWRLRRRAEAIGSSPGEIVIAIRDPFARLDRPIQRTLYAGTGGLEGGANIAGLPKPLCFGRCRNVPAVLVDEAALVYQVHDGGVEAISAVRDKGVALTADGDISTLMLASVYDWAQVPGHYVTDLASGLFVLGASPDGLVTADVDGDNAGGWVSSTPDVTRRIATRYGGLVDPDEIDAVSFAAFPNTATIGYFTGTQETQISAVIGVLLAAADGWATFTRDGRLRIGAYMAPEDVVPVATLTDALVDGLGSDSAADPAWRVRVGYRRMWAVQGEDELAAAVSAAEKATYSREYRFVAASDLDVRARHHQAQELELLTLFDLEADAQALADALLARQGDRRRLYSLTARRSLLRRHPGEVIRVTAEDAGLQTEKRLLVLGVAEDAPQRDVRLALWG